jgi:hypothetical protein
MGCLRATKGFDQRVGGAAMAAMDGEQRGIVEHGRLLSGFPPCLPFKASS